MLDVRNRKGQGSDGLMGTGSALGMMEIFWNYTVLMVRPYCEWSKCHRIVTPTWLK